MKPQTTEVLSAPRRPGADEIRQVEALLTEAEPLIVVDVARARQLLQQALTLAEALDFASGRTRALCQLAACEFFVSDYPKSRETFQLALDLSRATGDHATEARCVNGLGTVAHRLGDYGCAMEHFLESLRLSQERADEAGCVRVLSNIALLNSELGDHQQALDLHLDALRRARKLGNVVVEATAAVNTVVDYYRLGQYTQALELGRDALTQLRRWNIPQIEGVLHAYLALIYLATDRPEIAFEVCQEALPIVEQVHDRENSCLILTTRGRAEAALGRFQEGTASIRQALEVARSLGTKTRERDAHRYLSEVLERQGDVHGALRHARAYHDLERTVHAEEVDRKTKVTAAQIKVELLQREAEAERLRSVELASANHALQQAQQRLAHDAAHDTLTGLANRARFRDEVQRTLDESRGRDHLHAVLFVDLDRFKHVNDTLGHAVGDELLQAVAARLKDTVRTRDLVARMGGDEFTLLLRDLKHPEDAERVARKLLAVLAAPFKLHGHQLFVTASIGVAFSPQDGMDVITLQKHADIAMYRAKHAGRNAVRLFAPSMSTDELDRLTLERELREALPRGELVLHYQPQFDVQRGELVGFEALLRWQHPRLGLVPPAKFIPLAEDSGLIVPIGTWVIDEACRQGAAWSALRPGLSVAANVSALQFAQDDFVPAVQRALQQSGLPGQQLVLELTESLVMSDVERAVREVHRVRQLGVRVAMDDFGTGYSSLSLLQRLPIDDLKVDRSFLREALNDAGEAKPSALLVEAVVTLARGLKLNVTAEGVETPEQLEMLVRLGCHNAQGYYLGRPLPALEIEQRFLTTRA